MPRDERRVEREASVRTYPAHIFPPCMRVSTDNLWVSAQLLSPLGSRQLSMAFSLFVLPRASMKQSGCSRGRSFLGRALLPRSKRLHQPFRPVASMGRLLFQPFSHDEEKNTRSYFQILSFMHSSKSHFAFYIRSLLLLVLLFILFYHSDHILCGIWIFTWGSVSVLIFSLPLILLLYLDIIWYYTLFSFCLFG